MRNWRIEKLKKPKNGTSKNWEIENQKSREMAKWKNRKIQNSETQKIENLNAKNWKIGDS